MPVPINVKVVGCGGIGGALLPILCRYLNFTQYQFSAVEVTLIDGDNLEDDNAARPVIDSESNKVQATVDRLEAQFARISFRAIPTYLTKENVITLVHDGDVIFSCMDNHATKNCSATAAAGLTGW